MRALTWHGKHDVRVENVDDPEIINPRDAIIKITSTAICGSDLHLYDGYIPTMQKGDILGHEFMGEVVETGAKSTLQKGQRVVVPFTISCGGCFHCEKHQYSACENSLPAENQDIAQTLYGHPMAGLFGYSHMTGGYAGGQAEYVRVPFSDVGPIIIPDGVDDDKVLFLSDILPTGWMAAENADIEPGDTVAVWGCGPVGLFAVQSAFLMGAERVIAIDHFPRRLDLARKFGAETINYEESKTYEALMEMTGGIGPDACIDSVGLEAHGLLPQGRARIHACGLWRLCRQIPARRLHAKGADAQDRPDPRAALYARAAQRDHGRQGRYDLPHQPPPAARTGCGRISHVP